MDKSSEKSTSEPSPGFVDPSLPSPEATKVRNARLARAAAARKYLLESTQKYKS